MSYLHALYMAEWVAPKGERDANARLLDLAAMRDELTRIGAHRAAAETESLRRVLSAWGDDEPLRNLWKWVEWYGGDDASASDVAAAVARYESEVRS